MYAFDKRKAADGWAPASGLLDVAGELYGTTPLGGGTPCIGGIGCGTVYKVSTSGKEDVVYKFNGTPDGSAPVATLIAMNGELYGTTSEGGAGTVCNSPSGQCGTVFKVSTSGQETVLYTFTGGADGGQPFGGLIAVKGTLYGTTVTGGASNLGTVFSVSTSGKETVLHSFTNVPDGAYPNGGLTLLHGKLYGTTFAGGGGAGYGSVFEMSLSGQLQVIYSFLGDGVDGQAPEANMIAMNGKLYGTTDDGGTNGYGTVFQVTTSGKETVLYRFGGTTGGDPRGGVIAVNGELYGTTFFGGPFICHPSQNLGCGTVYRVSTSGKESVLHNFQGNQDGESPQGNLLSVNGLLYGTTSAGGPPNQGTIFKVSP
jgi:uncharacterized repeat protein (TIGR03803 family)